MNMRSPWILVATLGAHAALQAQLSVRPQDPLGLSIREERIRVVHSHEPRRPGTSMHLQATDPWLAYQRGRSYFHREWGRGDSVFGAAPDRPIAAATTSCAMCHNQPFRSAGSGGNTAEPIGSTRNTTHLFGVGLIETIAIQIRQQLFKAYDTNRNGILDVPAETRGRHALVEPAAGYVIDFGSFEDADADGLPDLNDAIVVRLVDSAGKPRPYRAPGVRSKLGDPGIAGIDLAVGAFGTAVGDHQWPTLRLFASGVLRAVFGLTVRDSTTGLDNGVRRDLVAGDGWAETSNAGAPQVVDPARGRRPGPRGETGGGVTEGELDLLEWYLLNHPSPATGQRSRESVRGRRLMAEYGCTSCHIPNWVIQSANEGPGFPGDRRFFDLAVKYNDYTRRLEGRLTTLVDTVPHADGTRSLRPKRGRYVVRDILTDFLHHDLGARFYEYTYQGGELYVLSRFRTAPLWGVGSTAPYGHDGRSATLDHVIRRHGGEAETSRRAYVSAPGKDREAVVAFLKSLVLYQPDVLPTDLDGDGGIAKAFRVGGRAVGMERFQPELLFRIPPRYRGWITPTPSDRFFSYELLNVDEAYGNTMEALLDTDGNGLPDALQHGSGAGLRDEAQPHRLSRRGERERTPCGGGAPHPRCMLPPNGRRGYASRH